MSISYDDNNYTTGTSLVLDQTQLIKLSALEGGGGGGEILNSVNSFYSLLHYDIIGIRDWTSGALLCSPSNKYPSEMYEPPLTHLLWVK